MEIARQTTHSGSLFLGENMENKTVTMPMSEYETFLQIKKAFSEDKILVRKTIHGYGATNLIEFFLPKDEAIKDIHKDQDAFQYRIKQLEGENEALRIMRTADNSFTNRLRFLFTGKLEYTS
jgi:hypothetical protein